MADQTAALARAIDDFIRNVRGMCSRVPDVEEQDVNTLWKDWYKIKKWSDKTEHPHNYSRGVLAARQFRQCLDKYHMDQDI